MSYSYDKSRQPMGAAMVLPMPLRDMLELLDGQGLVVTDYDDIVDALAGTGFSLDSIVGLSPVTHDECQK